MILMLLLGCILVITSIGLFFNLNWWWLFLEIPLFIIGFNFVYRVLRGRPHEVWDDIPSHEFQKSLNEERERMGVPKRPEKQIERYKKREEENGNS